MNVLFTEFTEDPKRKNSISLFDSWEVQISKRCPILVIFFSATSVQPFTDVPVLCN